MTGMGPTGSDSVIKTAKYVLGVAAVVAFIVVMLAVLSLLSFKLSAQQAPRQAWQLGICVDDPEVGRRCRLVGKPLPDEELCRALRDSLRSKINNGRVHCTKVLVDVEHDA